MKHVCQVHGEQEFTEPDADHSSYCRLCLLNAPANSVCGPVGGAEKGALPLVSVKIGPEYKDAHDLGKERAYDELKKLIERLNDRPVTPEQERVCRDWARGIAEAMAKGGLTEDDDG